MLMGNPSKSNDFIYRQPGARAAEGRLERTESFTLSSKGYTIELVPFETSVVSSLK
jgi:hypothetical protein